MFTTCALVAAVISVAGCGGGDAETDVSDVATSATALDIDAQARSTATGETVAETVGDESEEAEWADTMLATAESPDLRQTALSFTAVTDSQTSSPLLVSTDPPLNVSQAALNESDSLRNGSSAFTGGIYLNGQGLTQHRMRGCTPEEKADFIDARSRNFRRLLPADCRAVKTNPPVFAWPEPWNRERNVPWEFVLRDSSGVVVASHRPAHPRLALAEPLPSGHYSWTVRYTRTNGKPRASLPRRFAIQDGTRQAAFAKGTALAAQVTSRSHPRFVPAEASLEAIRALRFDRELAPIWTNLQARADAALETALPEAPDVETVAQSGVRSYAGKLNDNALRNLCESERRAIEALGFIGQVTGDSRYLNAGARRALNLASWSPEGSTSESSLDYANQSLYKALAFALDAFDAQLTRTEKQRIGVPLTRRVQQAMARFDGLDTNPFNSHVDAFAWSVVEALLYASGSEHFDPTGLMLADAWDLLLTTANSFGGDDGGFGNGVAYAWYRLDLIADSAAAVRGIAGVNLTEHPSLHRYAHYLMAMTAPGSNHMNAFGDAVEVNGLFGWYATSDLRLWATLSRDPVVEAYWRRDAAKLASTQYRGPWHLLLRGLSAFAQPLPTQAGQDHSLAFEDAGIVAMHDDFNQVQRSSVFFRSSDFGAWSHSFADQNAITMVSKGKDILVSGGYYPYRMSPHHAGINRATRYKNALTFDGGIGQSESGTSAPTRPGSPVLSRDARGQLVNHVDNGAWAMATGDATQAYRYYDASARVWRPLLDSAIRTVAYNRTQGVMVIYDHARSQTPRRWELNFQALDPFKSTTDGVRIDREGVFACLQSRGTAGKWKTSAGFDIAPEASRPIQYRATFAAQKASRDLDAITVLIEGCRDVPVDVQELEGGALAVRIGQQEPIRFQGATVRQPAPSR